MIKYFWFLVPKFYFGVDNVAITAGSGTSVATDDIGGVQYQRVKIAQGADGTGVDVSPAAPLNVTVASATLGTVTISGSVNVATATLGTVTVSLSSTAVTVSNSPLNVNVATATLGTVTISGNVNVATATLGTVTVSLSSTKVTIDNTPINVNVATATLGTVTVSLSSTAVTVSNSPLNVNVATATLGTVTISGSVTNSVSTIPIVGRTLTGSTGSLTATTGTVTAAPTNRAKVYGFSLTTTSSTELICIFHTGGLELWRLTLMAPSGGFAGANLAIAPPNFLFASRTGTAVSLSLNTATLVHYSTAYFDEA